MLISGFVSKIKIAEESQFKVEMRLCIELVGLENEKKKVKLLNTSLHIIFTYSEQKIVQNQQKIQWPLKSLIIGKQKHWN